MNPDKNLFLNRPAFPKKAVVTAGMPYGNKELYFHHIGAVFFHADTYARFLRDRIGAENVIFISGTDCYGSPIYEAHRQLVSSGEYSGSIASFVEHNHIKQKEALDAFDISIDFYAASALMPAKDIHANLSDKFIRRLYSNGYLKKMTTTQFYDTEHNTFLNGRQVIGKCPIIGCSSDRGYADECSLGHQYMPSELIDPISTLSGKAPEMKEVTNWYFKLDDFTHALKSWLSDYAANPITRRFSVGSIDEFLMPPVIYVKKAHMDKVDELKKLLPDYNMHIEANKSSVSLIFNNLTDRENACSLLSSYGVRYRTGKTLVPFRITGNIEWGVPAPSIEDLSGLTVWVWPESLFAPISFTMTYLEKSGRDTSEWKDWWCSKQAKVYQFLGIDNIYFYGPAEMAMFMAYNGMKSDINFKDGELQLPQLVVNNYLLFQNKKAGSSNQIKPPTAMKLLEYYTSEQLRSHFLGLGLSLRSVSFNPKPFEADSDAKNQDPVLKEGNLLTNVFNRFVRTCFYVSQNHYGGTIPSGDISPDILEEANRTILEYEQLMYRCEFHLVMNLMDSYIRGINKYASRLMREADISNDDSIRKDALINMFHMLRTAVTLLHPIAPKGTDLVREYLNIDKDIWSWNYIFEPIYFFYNNPNEYKLKYLEPRTDFFKKHQSQLSSYF